MITISSSPSAEISRLSEDAGFWSDNTRAQALLKEKAGLEVLVGAFDRVRRALDDAQALSDLAEEAGDEPTRAEAAAHAAAVAAEVEKLEFERMLSGPHDEAGAIVEVKSGAGGVERRSACQIGAKSLQWPPLFQKRQRGIITMSRVIKKRRKKMRKHKYRKLRKRTRHQRNK